MLIDSSTLHHMVTKGVAHKAQHRIATCGCQVTFLSTSKTDRGRRSGTVLDLYDFGFNRVPSNGSIDSIEFDRTHLGLPG